MVPFKLFTSHARRQCFHGPRSYDVTTSFRISHLLFSRLCTSSSSSSDSIPDPIKNDTPRRVSQSVPIQPVSYPAKPKDPSTPDEAWPQQKVPSQSSSSSSPPPPPRRPREFINQEARGSWTREDARFVKDVPTISPVSYPARVAPLPEYNVSAEQEGRENKWDVKEEKEKDAGLRVEIERERKRIESGNLLWKKVFRGEEEQKAEVPFPAFIKVEKREKMPVLDLSDAIRQVKANAKRKFDETVEAHVRLGIDRKRTDLTVRGSVALPHGVGKVVKVAFFAEGADAEEARAAGADIVGGVELVEEIARTGKLDVDKCFSTPQFMNRLTKIAPILGPQGLMPVPKRGTVTSDVSGAVKEAKRGVVDFRMDKTAIVHVGLGKVSYSEESLRDNICAFVNALLLAKPAGLKKTSKYAGYVNSFHICSSMGPGFPVSIQSLSKATDQYSKAYLK